MRITSDVVREISRYAGLLSNGYVRDVQTGRDQGSAARILDGNSQTVWLGKPREAAAYYLGQVDAFANARGVALGDYPLTVAEARSEIHPGAIGQVAHWYMVGQMDGRSRVRNYCPEIKGAGVPRA